VQQAQGEQAPTQRFVDQFARYYIPAVVILALVVGLVVPMVLHAAFLPWVYKALVLLVIACPCALVISTPVTVVSGLAAAAKHGILIKGGVYLEEGAKLRAIALDKTGTITLGKPSVTDVIAMSDRDAEELARLAASLSVRSDHPVSSAVVSHWNDRKVEGPLLDVSNFEAVPGRGVKGMIGGDTYYLGNHRMAHELGVCGAGVESQVDALEKEGKTVVMLSSTAAPLLIIAVADTIRPTSAAAIADIKAMGVDVVMLTGDNAHTAHAIGAKVGIGETLGDLLPEDKLQAIKALSLKYGHVGMVGDGTNDAPALAKAAIGFAMGAAGTDTALETADVALMDDELGKLASFLRLSAQTRSVLRQNIVLALGIKAVFLVLAFSGHATLWMAVFADMGTSLLVVFNGLRLLRALK
jgi:Cd2+/Zn2+-exporting ATPase